MRANASWLMRPISHAEGAGQGRDEAAYLAQPGKAERAAVKPVRIEDARPVAGDIADGVHLGGIEARRPYARVRRSRVLSLLDPDAERCRGLRSAFASLD